MGRPFATMRRDEIHDQLVRTPAQKRILEVFGQWKAPGNFKIEFFVIRVGEWGGIC
jgi:hypothetical protein